MEETLRAQLLKLADIFETAAGVTKPSVGKLALGDNTFFRRIAAGDNFTIKTFDKIVQWFAENWPEAADWPSDLARPVLSRAGAPSEPERAAG